MDSQRFENTDVISVFLSRKPADGRLVIHRWRPLMDVVRLDVSSYCYCSKLPGILRHSPLIRIIPLDDSRSAVTFLSIPSNC